MTNIIQKQIKQFQKEILEWYKVNKRNLPWRSDREPYHILISEVMLQQTQVGRVIPKFNEWIKLFPTVQSLAKASTADVLRAWSGLGYNRRAIYLKKSAEKIVNYSSNEVRSSRIRSNNKEILNQVQDDETRDVLWPKTEKELRKLPGIGEYTARAILCFAFNEQIAVVDTNIRKVILTRIKNYELGIKQKKTDSGQARMTKKEVQEIAEMLLPKGKAYEWNQALMDYASSRLRHIKIGFGEAKQSTFKGSNRYYRGYIMKALVTENSLTISEIHKRLENEISKEKLEEIIKGLIKEGMIERDRQVLRISN